MIDSDEIRCLLREHGLPVLDRLKTIKIGGIQDWYITEARGVPDLIIILANGNRQTIYNYKENPLLKKE
jgi:hypothetical protein